MYSTNKGAVKLADMKKNNLRKSNNNTMVFLE